MNIIPNHFNLFSLSLLLHLPPSHILIPFVCSLLPFPYPFSHAPLYLPFSPLPSTPFFPLPLTSLIQSPFSFLPIPHFPPSPHSSLTFVSLLPYSPSPLSSSPSYPSSLQSLLFLILGLLPSPLSHLPILFPLTLVYLSQISLSLISSTLRLEPPAPRRA